MRHFIPTWLVVLAALLLGAWGQDEMNGTLFRYGKGRMSAAFMTGAPFTPSLSLDCRSLRVVY